MYGIQTTSNKGRKISWFENDVKMYGIQTKRIGRKMFPWFENDVKMYGIQTFPLSHIQLRGLRMM